jgi:hypothetical protein
VSPLEHAARTPTDATTAAQVHHFMILSSEACQFRFCARTRPGTRARDPRCEPVRDLNMRTGTVEHFGGVLIAGCGSGHAKCSVHARQSARNTLVGAHHDA